MSEEVQVTPEEVQEAISMGWVDKDQWKGPPEHWVDAKSFLDKGRQVLPILSATNARQKEELRKRDSMIAELQGSVRALSANVEVLNASHEEDAKAQLEAQRAELTGQLEQASRDGDHAGVARLTGEIAALPQKIETTTGGDRKDLDDLQPKPIPPEIKTWFETNQVYASDPYRQAVLQAAIRELRESGDKTVGTVFLDAAKKKADAFFQTQRPSTSKVNPDTGGGGGGGSGGQPGKTYADLPKEAKDVCERQAARLVGPNRLHKTIDSWRASYAKQYFKE